MKATRKIMELLVREFAKAPRSQISKDLKDKFRKVRDNIKSYSNAQLYDFLNDISKNDLAKISGFVATACDLDRFYEGPEDD